MIVVGIADLNITKEPDVLATYALGSCVGIALYDAESKVAGLAHIMLPWSKDAPSAADNMRRYADTGITELIQLMCANGAKKYRLTAKIAGGAQMFAATSSVFNIGERNVEAVRTVLGTYNIPIIASQTGENFGRTVFFHSDTGGLEIKAATRPTVTI
ncbi:MAG: chemotaxis protein CheD [Huintestinicola sp.]